MAPRSTPTRTRVPFDEDGPNGAALDALPPTPDDPTPDDDDDDDDDSGEGDPDDDSDEGDSGEGDPEPITLAEAPPPPRADGFAPRNGFVELNQAPSPREPRPPGPPRPSYEPASPMPRGRGPRGPRSMSAEQKANSAGLNRMRQQQESRYQELDGIIAGLNFKERKYEIRVERIEPEEDENGVPCTGVLHTFKTAVTVDQIMQKFGGGTYEIKLWGPHPATGEQRIIKTETVKFAGFPVPMRSQLKRGRRGGYDDDDDGRDSTADVLQVIAETNEKSQARLMSVLERQKNQPSAITELLPVLQPLIEKLMSKGDESAKAMVEASRAAAAAEAQRRTEEFQARLSAEAAAREAKAEERRQEDKREERRRQELKEERDELRRLEEKKEAERREQAKQDRLDTQREEDKREARAKEERDREYARMKEEAAEKQRQHERDLAAQAERSKEENQRRTEHMKMLTDMQNNQMEMMERRQESGGLESVTKQLMMLKDLRGALTGEDQEPSKLDTVMEGIERAVGVAAPLGQQFITAWRGQPTGAPGQPGAPAASTKAVVVDLGPARQALPAHAAPSAPSGAPVAVSNANAPDALQDTDPPFERDPPTGAAPTSAAEQDGPVNDFKRFHFPTQNDDMQIAAFMLMKDFDLAVQKNMTAEDIVIDIIQKFEDTAPMMMNMAGGLTVQQALDFLVANVPNKSWAIMSPRGHELIMEAFTLWHTDPEAS